MARMASRDSFTRSKPLNTSKAPSMTAGHVALVGHAHIGHGVAADKAIAAHEAEHSGQHLIAAGAVVRVQQHDFVGLRAVDLAGVAQAHHVFGVLALAFIAHAGLRHHEGLKPSLRSSVSTAAVGM
jgi:hypothetical protein